MNNGSAEFFRSSPNGDNNLEQRLYENISWGLQWEANQHQQMTNGIRYLQGLQQTNSQKSPRFSAYIDRLIAPLRACDQGAHAPFGDENSRAIAKIMFEAANLVKPDSESESPDSERGESSKKSPEHTEHAKKQNALSDRLEHSFLVEAQSHGIDDIMSLLVFWERFNIRICQAFSLVKDAEPDVGLVRCRVIMLKAVRSSISTVLEKHLKNLSTDQERDEYIRDTLAHLAEAKIFSSESAAFLSAAHPPAGVKRAQLGGFAKVISPEFNPADLFEAFGFFSTLFSQNLENLLRLGVTEISSFAMTRILTGQYLCDEETCWQNIQEGSRTFNDAVRTRPTQGNYALDCTDLFEQKSLPVKIKKAIITVDGSIEKPITLDMELVFTDNAKGLMATLGFPSFADAKSALEVMGRADPRNKEMFGINASKRSFERICKEKIWARITIDRPPGTDNTDDMWELMKGSIFYNLIVRALAMHLSKSTSAKKPSAGGASLPARPQLHIPTHVIRKTDPITTEPNASTWPAEAADSGTDSVAGTIIRFRQAAYVRLPEGQFPSVEAYDRANALGIKLYVFLVPIPPSVFAMSDMKEEDVLKFPLEGIPHDLLRDYVDTLSQSNAQLGPFSVRVHTYRRETNRPDDEPLMK